MGQMWKGQELSSEQESIIQDYCSNEMGKLKQICSPIFSKMGEFSNVNHDDLYSIAMDVLGDSVVSYDETKKCKFKTYLTQNIKRKYKSYIRDKNRAKRSNNIIDENGNQIFRNNISLDSEDEESISLLKTLKSDFSIESKLNGVGYTAKIDKYLESLSSRQRSIAKMIMSGKKKRDIIEALNLSNKEWYDSLREMRDYDKIKFLKENKDQGQDKEDECMEMDMSSFSQEAVKTLEKSKPMHYSVSSIISKMDNKKILFNHPLQRNSEQWDRAKQSNLISDILQGNPIPELVNAEQFYDDGNMVIWNIDGKQRCTTVWNFRYGKFKIKKDVTRPIIKWKGSVKDDDGNLVLNNNGLPLGVDKEFDLRNKGYNDLPDDLKDKFNDYLFNIVYYIDCSAEDIAYHIARYNNGRPMNASQKGITHLGETFARMVKNISAMELFNDLGAYTVAERRNGTVDRVVVESVMAQNFIDDWVKDQNAMCEYLKNNAEPEMFNNFEDVVDRLTKVGNEEFFENFNSKNSFIWFGLFGRFSKTGNPDSDFVKFMAEFSRSLHNKEINGISYDSLCVNPETGKTRATKDRSIVTSKMNILTKLMYEYFGNNEAENNTETIEENCNEEVLNTEPSNEFSNEFSNEEISNKEVELEKVDNIENNNAKNVDTEENKDSNESNGSNKSDENNEISVSSSDIEKVDVNNEVVDEDFLEDFIESDLIESSNLTEDEKKEAAIETLKMIDGEPDDVLLLLDSLNEWLLEIENGDQLIARETIPAMIKVVDWIYQKNYDDKVGVEMLNKYLHNTAVFSNDSFKNFNDILAYAAA